MSASQGIQRRANQGGHRWDAGNGDPATLKRSEVGDFQRGLDAYLEKRGLKIKRRKRA